MIEIKKVLSLIAGIFMAFTPALARDTLLPFEMEGSMMPYDFSQESEKAVWNDSLKPIYVAHVARHGARFISSEKKLTRISRILSEAEANGNLTKIGKDFARLLQEVKETTGERWGELSEVGCEEEKRLAQELMETAPMLKGNISVEAYSSYVPRVVKTMYEYCGELSLRNPKIEINTGEGRRYDYLLRCFESDAAYGAYRKRGNWEAVYDRMVDSVVPVRPARALLRHAGDKTDKELKQLTLEIYDVLQSLRAFGMAAPDDRFMNAEEYRRCWEADNLLHYLRNTDTPLSKLAGKASAPLLARIISDADNALGMRLMRMARNEAEPRSTGDTPVCGTFYFGHAETLMPLLSLMRIEGCHDDTGDYGTLSQRWRDYEIVPLGANLDILLLGSPSGNIHVALRLNGRYLSPVPGGGKTPLWQDYRNYLISLIRELD